MKSKLPFKATFRLALKGKWLTRIVTIALCSFCFALVALSSTKFAYDRTAYAAEEVLFAAQHVDGLTVFDYESYFEHDLYGDGKGEALTQYNIDLITEGTGLDFLYYYQGGNDYSIYSGVAGVPLFYSVYGMEGKEYRDIQDAVCGPYPLLEELGYTMAAGRYPENIREIAVTEAQFETFRELGFSDNEGLMDRVEYGRHELQDGTIREGHMFPNGSMASNVPAGYAHDGYFFHYGNWDSGGWTSDPEWSPQEKTEIGTYDDLLGKEVILWGDPETGELDITAFYKAKIVGIVKTPKEEELDLVRAGSYARRFAETVVYWEGWRDVFFADGDPLCHEMVAPPVETLQEARACVEVSERMIDSYFERFPVTGINDVPQSVGVNGLPKFSSMFGEEMWYPMWYTQETGAVFIMLVAAAVFLVVSLLLCWHVTTASLKQKEREIGILRSAGASSAEVKKLVLTETLFLCCCIFLVSLILTLAGYYGFLVAPYAPWYPWQTGTFAHATEFVFNGWTVLILAGLSFGVPLLCSVVPLKKFLKKSIVDNISGNIRAR